MLMAEEVVEIWVLRRQGKSIREIARMLDVSRNTVRRYLRAKDYCGTSVKRDRASLTPISITSMSE
jgi:transposase